MFTNHDGGEIDGGNITNNSNNLTWNRPEISWYLGDQLVAESDKYSFYRAIQVN